MHSLPCLRYLIGHADAIRAVASSRATIPTGLLLVLLTSIARNYDQSWIGEHPFLWIFGPLLFSLVSGTWIFLVTYAGWIRRGWTSDTRATSVWRDWPTFMGLFWLTAPVAWLYAIPVERFLDPVGAARANVTLLSLVSLWRVLLFARVIQVVSGVRYWTALVWVLVPVSIEAVAVLVPLGMGPAIARGMGGLRHSPAETVILEAVSVATLVAMITAGISLVTAFVLPRPTRTERLPAPMADRLPGTFLAGATAFWLAAAVLVQPSARRSAQVEERVRTERYADALAFLRNHRPGDFAPARPLPPKPYEHATFQHQAGLLAEAREDEPRWIQEHLIRRLDDLVDSTRPIRRRAAGTAGDPAPATFTPIQPHHGYWQKPEDLHRLVTRGVGRLSWLAAWRQQNREWLEAWAALVNDAARGRLRRRYDGAVTRLFDTPSTALPRFDLLAGRPYNRLTVQTSRGCPRHCEFCAASLRITRGYQQKPVPRVLQEIREARRHVPIPFLELADDNTFLNPDWSRTFLRAMVEENLHWFTETDLSVAEDPDLCDLLAASGCRQLLIGLESPDGEALAGMDPTDWKRRRAPAALRAIDALQSRGVSVNGCFILGLDSHTPDVFPRILQFVRSSGLAEVQVTVLTPFPGTPLHDRLRRTGRLLAPRFWDRCTLFDVVYRPARMTVTELESGLRWLMKELYSRRETDDRRRAFTRQRRPSGFPVADDAPA
ncbi:MAG: radical SAM protein [Verrucomicrobiae bacterium]|nr:radical SAM protein [Verrucomicrobiae bacterium]